MNSNNKFESKLKKKSRREMIQYINLQLAALGHPVYENDKDDNAKLSNARFNKLTEGLISSFREKSRLLTDHLSPADTRIQNFLDDYLKELDFKKSIRLPSSTFVLNQPGLAREVSLPPDGNTFKNELLSSYRLKQGILNNPAKDKRTTKGTFHIVEGGLPVALDKIEVPKIAFAHMLHSALHPSNDINVLPFTANQEKQAKTNGEY